MKTMYRAIPNSPIAKLKTSINETDVIIKLTDTSVIPAPPNLLCISNDDGSLIETVLFTTTPVNDTLVVARGIETVARSWSAGVNISRVYTSLDHNNFIENIEELDERTQKIPLTNIQRTDKRISSVQKGNKTITYTRDSSGKIISWEVN